MSTPNSFGEMIRFIGGGYLCPGEEVRVSRARLVPLAGQKCWKNASSAYSGAVGSRGKNLIRSSKG